MHILRAMIAIISLVGTAAARDPLGVFSAWGAFRDDKPRHCFAIAEPDPRHTNAPRRSFASVANWPGMRIQSQVHFRLREDRAPDTPVVLTIGDARFALVAGKADAWAPDRRTDAAIVRTMRSAAFMRISARSTRGAVFSDTYPLRGAATAIDAATIACAR